MLVISSDICLLYLLNATLYNTPGSFYGTQIWTIRVSIKYIKTLVLDERGSACRTIACYFIMLEEIVFAWEHGAFTL